MNDQGLATFEEHRRLLHAIAYRMLGSRADAEDVLQEARIKWMAEQDGVETPRAWLVTIVSRLCLDQLGSARNRRETYVGEWLPEPMVTGPDSDPAHVSMAFMVLLERLSPAERAAFLLSDVFDYGYAEVGKILGKSEAACRQLSARARKHVKEARPRPVDRAEHARAMGMFVNACVTGDLAALEQLLATDVVARTDHGGKARATRRRIHGAARVGRLMAGLARKGLRDAVVEAWELNGLPALVVREGDQITSAVMLDVVEGRVQAVYIVRNPDKLQLTAAAP